MKLLVIIILFGAILQAQCLFTFYQLDSLDSTYYKCIRQTSNGQIIQLFPYFQDEVFDGYMESLQYALQAGLTVDLVITPTRCRSVDDDLAFLFKNLEGKKIDRAWIALQDQTDSDCIWENYSPKDNCLYLQEYIAKAGKLGMKMEIVSMLADWIPVFQDPTGCP